MKNSLKQGHINENRKSLDKSQPYWQSQIYKHGNNLKETNEYFRKTYIQSQSWQIRPESALNNKFQSKKDESTKFKLSSDATISVFTDGSNDSKNKITLKMK